MGISDLYSLIKEHCPDVLITVNLADLTGISVAVDISIFLNKYVKSAGEVRWMETFIVLLRTLKNHGINPVCIFDGPNPPREKKKEQERRRAEGAKKKERINRGKALVKRLEEAYIPDSKEPPQAMKDEIRMIIGSRRDKAQSVKYDDVYDIVACLKDAIDKLERQNLPILPIYSKQAKEIIEIMGFAHFQADGEAEGLCASMCHLGYVDAVLSEDTDVLAIGAPFLLSKLDLSTQTVTAISHSDILAGLGMESVEFRDLCILLGCDYNHRVKGYPPDGKNRKKPVCIGAKGAYSMIKEYRRLEIAEQFMEDSDPLNYRRCRELLLPLKELPDISIPYNNPIDKRRLSIFVNDNNIKINFEYIISAWKPPVLNFHYPQVGIEWEADEAEIELFDPDDSQ